MYNLFLSYYLVSFLINFFIAKHMGRFYYRLLTMLGVGLIMYSCSILLMEVFIYGEELSIKLWNWIDIAWLQISFGIYIDSLTVIMLIMINLISIIVVFYSWEYMAHDLYRFKFFSYLNLFTFFMLLLVCADNYVQMFIGWEGVGLTSYLLITFWNTRMMAVKAGLKAMFLNRIGDIGLLIAIGLLILNFGSSDYSVIYALSAYIIDWNIIILNMNFKLIDIIVFMLILGAIAKSAQIGLHQWLPDAMEGPTPVSALIHAATMVTAGIFLVVRSSYLFEYSSLNLFILMILGSLTCVFAGFKGIFQQDIKKVVAYSTTSQLGYMFFSCGLSNYTQGLFHLFNHAFFKALLFLSMGSLIHALFDEQDYRRMGGLLKYLPITYISIIIGSLSLMGLPYTIGFYSKDFLIESAYVRLIIGGYFSYTLSMLGVFFTAYYSIKLIFNIFLEQISVHRKYIDSIQEGFGIIIWCLLTLSFLSIFLGYFINDFFTIYSNIFFSNSVFNSYLTMRDLDVEFEIYLILKLLPLIFTLLGIFCYYIFFIIRYQILDFMLLQNKWIKKFWSLYLFDDLYLYKLLDKIYKLSYFKFVKVLEKGILPFFFINIYSYVIIYFINYSKNIYMYVFWQIYIIITLVFILNFCILLEGSVYLILVLFILLLKYNTLLLANNILKMK